MATIAREIRQMYLICARSLVEGRIDLDGADDAGLDIDLPVLTVGQVATLADIHPQTLRQYDRLRIIVPKRTEGGARRYSVRDLDRLCQAQHMSQHESINLAGITSIFVKWPRSCRKPMPAQMTTRVMTRMMSRTSVSRRRNHSSSGVCDSGGESSAAVSA
ncbi:MAG: MerR family transcriptional regulator [Bifidobacterium psychraerophilum]